MLSKPRDFSLSICRISLCLCTKNVQNKLITIEISNIRKKLSIKKISQIENNVPAMHLCHLDHFHLCASSICYSVWKENFEILWQHGEHLQTWILSLPNLQKLFHKKCLWDLWEYGLITHTKSQYSTSIFSVYQGLILSYRMLKKHLDICTIYWYFFTKYNFTNIVIIL